MLQVPERGALLCLSCCLLIGVCCSAEGTGTKSFTGLFPEGSGEAGFGEWGSGSSFLHSFPADSPFIAESPGKPANCTQHFWLPSTISMCWANIAGPEEFAKSRLLVLQNRAALQAVSSSSGVEEGGPSYDLQAQDEVQGIRSDHQSAAETMLTMEKVFVSLEEKRREDKQQGVLTSMKERLINTKTAIDRRENMATILENDFSTLEQTLLNTQLRISKLIQ